MENGQEIYKSRMSYGYYYSQEQFGKKQKVIIPFELSLVYVPQNSKIEVQIYSNTPNKFSYNQKEKDLFYKNNITEGNGYLDIDLSNPIKLHIPLELSLTKEAVETTEIVNNKEDSEIEEVVIGP
jgi:hypothetical protein